MNLAAPGNDRSLHLVSGGVPNGAITAHFFIVALAVKHDTPRHEEFPVARIHLPLMSSPRGAPDVGGSLQLRPDLTTVYLLSLHPTENMSVRQ